jgi:hypothetical protein
MEHFMHWSKISLAMLRALSLAGVIGILVSGGAVFAQDGMGHDHARSKMSKIRIGHPIIIKRKHRWYFEHHNHKHRYPYPGRIRGPLPPTPKPPPSMQGGMPPGGAAPAPGRTIPTAPAPGSGHMPAPAPAPGGSSPAPK